MKIKFSTHLNLSSGRTSKKHNTVLISQENTAIFSHGLHFLLVIRRNACTLLMKVAKMNVMFACVAGAITVPRGDLPVSLFNLYMYL